MKPTLHCPAREDGDVIHQYVAGTLAADEQEVFELHLLECAACQQAVREGRAIRDTLRLGASGARRRGYGWVLPAGLAVAAAATWLFLSPGKTIRALGGLDRVPAFEPLPVRADPDAVAALVDSGMTAYVAGDFARAADMLSRAAESDHGPGIAFFLGVARLKAGAPEEARTALTRALVPSGNPYAAEARLYLAKTWLARAEGDSALAHLGRVPPEPVAVNAHAVALADSVRRVMR